MKLSESSKNRLEMFFREILQDESFCLPSINFYAGKFSKVFTKILQVNGITFGRNIFILPDLIHRDFKKRQKLSLELAAHEIAHVLQYKREGSVRFFYKYLNSYWKNLRQKNDLSKHSRQQAYLEIPFEQEAREIAARFTEWNRVKKFTA